MAQQALPLDGFDVGPLFAPIVKIRPLVRPKGWEGRVHRAQTVRATPPWADMDKIKAMYAEARRMTELTGELHVVDHIIPKIHDFVCGLHVHENMQVLHWLVNAQKANIWPPNPELFGDDT